MYNYRLTTLGKCVLFAFILILFCLFYFEISQIIVSAENEKNVAAGNNVTANIEDLHAIQNKDSQKTMNQDKTIVSNDEENLSSAGYIKQSNKTENANSFLTIPVENAFDDPKRKVVFLTFDDGPSRNISPQILAILRKNKVKATFFVLGKYAVINKDIIKDIYNDGNVIGLHGYSHKYDVIYSSKESFRDEITRTSSILTDILGKNFKTRLFRFPGGSFESSKEQFKTVLKDMNYAYVDWNVVVGDAEAKTNNSDSKALYDRFISTVKNKNHVILLMHDSSTKQETADILPKVIDYLRSNGYEFAVFK